ncbi:MAG: hypothetical protein WC045_03545 [Patescibacteria group bacterium]
MISKIVMAEKDKKTKKRVTPKKVSTKKIATNKASASSVKEVPTSDFLYVGTWIHTNWMYVAGAFTGLVVAAILVIAGLHYINKTSDMNMNTDDSVAQDSTTEESPSLGSQTESDETLDKRIYIGPASKQLAKAISEKEKADENNIAVQILKFDEIHAKGRFFVKDHPEDVNPRNDSQDWKPFFAVQFNTVWTIVSVNDENPTCMDLKKYTFPADIMYPCSDDNEKKAWSDTDLEDQVSKILEQRYGSDQIDFIDIAQFSGDFVRGVLNLTEGEHDFYLKKSTDGWNVVYDGAGAIPCDELKEAGFPQDMFLSSCYPEYEIIR